MFLGGATAVITDYKFFNNICPEGRILMTLFNQTLHIKGVAIAGKMSQSMSLSLGLNDYQ